MNVDEGQNDNDNGNNNNNNNNNNHDDNNNQNNDGVNHENNNNVDGNNDENNVNNDNDNDNDNENNDNENNNNHGNNNNNNNNNNNMDERRARRRSGRSGGRSYPAASDLHDAILANSRTAVEHYLREGADPNRSPSLAPVGVIGSSTQERARDLHRTLGRVFRSRQTGTIHPIHVAICNAYHHCVLGREEALAILKALLQAGADPRSTCSGIAFCKIGVHPTVTIASSKAASKVVLFLKRFPLKGNEGPCWSMLDEVAKLILQAEAAQQTKNRNEPPSDTTQIPTSVHQTWSRVLENPSYTDIRFVCPDGEVEAHKSILAAAVPYFATAFQGPWKESTEDGGKRWPTTNKVAVVKAVLQFVYVGQVDQELLENDTESLLSVATEYEIEQLQRLCERKCIEKLSVESVKSMLQLAHLREMELLKQKCFDFIHEQSAAVLTDTAFMSLATENTDLWSEMAQALRSRSHKRRRESAS